MEIPIPFGVNRIKHFRIAGSANHGEIIVRLIRLTFPRDDGITVLTKKIDTKGEFDKTYDVYDARFDPEFSALSVEVEAKNKADIWVIGVEFMG